MEWAFLRSAGWIYCMKRVNFSAAPFQVKCTCPNLTVNRIVKPRLQTVPGVADVRICGDRKYSMRVWLDPDKLAALPPDGAGRRGRAARSRTSRCRPAASRAAQREFSVTARTDLNTAGAVRRDRAEDGQRLPGAPARRGARRGGGRRRAQQRAPQRRAVGVSRRHPQGHRQPARPVAGRARGDAAAPAATCRPASTVDSRQRQLGVHRPLDQVGVHAPSPRRWCWWRW